MHPNRFVNRMFVQPNFRFHVFKMVHIAMFMVLLVFRGKPHLFCFQRYKIQQVLAVGVFNPDFPDFVMAVIPVGLQHTLELA